MATNIGKRLEPLWDYFLVDKEKTTATLSVNQPEFLGSVFSFDAPWEGNACVYPNIIKDGNKYRLYYGAREFPSFNPEKGKLDETKIAVCVIESEDGINWSRPTVGKYGKNNIVNAHPTEARTALSVFIDENPDCPPDRKYKGLDRVDDGAKSFLTGGTLAAFASADGLNFERIEDISRDPGRFDSLNTVFYNKEEGQYRIYYRDFIDEVLRIVACKTSKDFKTWKNIGPITFDDDEFFQLYTNNIMQYPRAPHVYIGTPVRYTERTAWTTNYDQMPDRELRRGIMYSKDYERLGLALTDSIFMCSRDGMHFHRFQESFVDSGLEMPLTWKYGHNFLSYGYTEDENYIYIYSITEHLHKSEPSKLLRYRIRQDGFASFKAPYSGAKVVTKPFVFDGDSLTLNFRTSAAGNIYVKMCDNEGNTSQSIEIFGNSINRNIEFDKPLSAFSGKEVVMEFSMKDAHLYSFKFE